MIIKICDEGMGIPEDLLKNIMDPFFTTRQDYGGTGLGLSISYNIVKEHGGDLKFISEVPKGTTVKLIFPVKGINC